MHDFIFYGVHGSGVAAIKVHDNFIQYPTWTGDHSYGDDMAIWPGGMDFYNNTVQTHPRSTYGSGSVQHSDMFQTRSSNIRVYNNTIIDPGESVFYEDSNTSATVNNILIYNNLIVRSFACNGGGQRIFDMNPEGAGLNTVGYVDMVIANNTVVDQQGACIFFTRVSGAGSYTRVYVVNNIQYPSDSGLSGDSGVTISNNYAGTAVKFMSYISLGGANNDLHLTATDSVAKDKGRTMSTYFTIDKYAIARPQGPAWDIGAYEYNGNTQTTSTAAPTGLTAMSH